MLDDKVDLIKGIGLKYQRILYENNIETKRDLLFFLPKRFIDYKVEDPNEIHEDITTTIKGVVDSNLASIKFRSSGALLFYIISNNKRIKVLAFGMEYLRYKIKKGHYYAFFGAYKAASAELYIKNVFDENFKEFIEPVYPIKIANSYIMKFISEIYQEHPMVEDKIPEYLLEKRNLLDINTYLYKSHFPNDLEDVSFVSRRYKYETYLNYNLRLNALRYYYDISKKEAKDFSYNKILELIRSLPYKLTDGQNKALYDVFSDMRSKRLMNRLIQGDVGSGKTIIAFIALYANYLAGFQGALMVPSEVLSNQHYDKILALLSQCSLKIGLLNSGVKSSEKKKIYKGIESGEIDILIGTQSLIQDGIMFNKLGLVVIDEQHRFGVRERQELINKGIKCDSLFLSATPIPRTLGISKYADLDITTVETMPSNRKRVLTKVCNISDDEFICKAIYKNVMKNHQVFVVVPVINESNLDGIIDVNEAYERLSKHLPDVRFKILHGGMKSSEKNQIMQDFKNHNFDCLISTTVIEVGIDIKNATLMVVYNAERYGLATLHQLRGRVGRNDLNCGCILATDKEMCERLKIMEETYDCFKLAEEDLALRGPGDLLGSSQSGFVGLNILNDMDIFKEAQEDALELYKKYENGNAYKLVSDILENNNENNKLN